MVGKRSREDSKDHPETSHSASPKRQKKPNGAPHGSHIPPVAPIKQKIHDLTRALEHNEHMPANVRNEKERALLAYKMDLQRAELEKQKQMMIKRYHMVRFFERQRAERHVKKAQKVLEASGPEQPDFKQLQEDLHVAKVDVTYTIYFPLTEKYVSLYPRKDETDPSRGYGTSVEKKPAVWKVVKQCMAEGTLDALRDGALIPSLNGMKELEIKKKAAIPKGRVVSRAKADDEDSDGGFFE